MGHFGGVFPYPPTPKTLILYGKNPTPLPLKKGGKNLLPYLPPYLCGALLPLAAGGLGAVSPRLWVNFLAVGQKKTSAEKNPKLSSH